jgi:fructose-bisphosphate aldolase, class I
VRGGGKTSDDEIVNRTYELVRQGAAGIVYGRNVIQHERPAHMVRALMALIHDAATAEQALAIVRA